MSSYPQTSTGSTGDWDKVEPEVELKPNKVTIATKEEVDEKTKAIKEAIETKDVEALRELATTRDGLMTDELRKDAC